MWCNRNTSWTLSSQSYRIQMEIPMKILITGGAGFIGSNIASLLIEKGHEIIIFDNLSSGRLENIEHLNLTIIEGDILDMKKLSKACQGVDAVYHLAASVGRQKSIDFPQEDSNINLIGTINVLECMKEHHIQRIIYSSSAAIYGELMMDTIDEHHPINPDSPYGVSKLAAEKMIFAYANLYGFVAIALRYFNIYGQHQKYDLYGNVIPIFVKRLLNHEPITIYGDGQQTRDFLNVSDVAYANYLALSYPKSDYFNLGSGTRITIQKLADLLIQNIGHGEIKYGERRIGDVLHCQADIDKASRLLNYAPTTDLKTGLKDYIEWYKTAF